MNIAMIDIECLSTRPEAVVLQIGLDIRTRAGEPLASACIDLDVQEQIACGHHVDYDTLVWWTHQSQEARQSVFTPLLTSIRTPNRTSFWAAYEYVKRSLEAQMVEQVWAKPAMYDLPILTSLWEGQRPWGDFRKERDMLTLIKLIDPERKLAAGIKTYEPQHNALADAKWQMDYLLVLLDKLDEMKGTK